MFAIHVDANGGYMTIQLIVLRYCNHPARASLVRSASSFAIAMLGSTFAACLAHVIEQHMSCPLRVLS